MQADVAHRIPNSKRVSGELCDNKMNMYGDQGEGVQWLDQHWCTGQRHVHRKRNWGMQKFMQILQWMFRVMQLGTGSKRIEKIRRTTIVGEISKKVQERRWK